VDGRSRSIGPLSSESMAKYPRYRASPKVKPRPHQADKNTKRSTHAQLPECSCFASKTVLSREKIGDQESESTQAAGVTGQRGSLSQRITKPLPTGTNRQQRLLTSILSPQQKASKQQDGFPCPEPKPASCGSPNKKFASAMAIKIK